jgi:hypothetical protein
MTQLFLNNFESTFVASVNNAPVSGTPATELDYGVLRISDGAAGMLINPVADYYLLTAYKQVGTSQSNLEILKVTAVNNAVPGECRITVERGQEGTPVQAYVAGDHISLRLTKGGIDNMVQDAELTAGLAAKQATLVSGASIKTVGGVSLLGSGNIVIASGGDPIFQAINFGGF